MSAGRKLKYALEAVTASLLIACAGCALIGSGRVVRPLPPDWDIADDSRPTHQNPPATPPPKAPAAVPLEPGIPVLPEPDYRESWTSLAKWSQLRGYGLLTRVWLPHQPLSLAITNGFQWNNLNLKGVSVITPLPTYSLKTSAGELVVQTETRQAYWNGIAFYLGFAPKLVQGEVLIRDLDLHQTIEPLMDSSDLPELPPSRTIVIDPGHGGSDAGATNITDQETEKTFTLDWAKRLGSRLERRGWQVVLTRTNDAELSPAQRISVAESHHADLFISLHFSYSDDNADLAGVETYCLAPLGLPAYRMRHHADQPWQDFPNNQNDAASLRCAFRCQRALVTMVGAADQGVRRLRFSGVLADQQRPAILVTGGYLSNASEARLISNSVYRDRLAEAVADSLE